MRQDVTLYFTPAEFLLLLELSGGGTCYVLSGGEQPGDEELTLAFTSLFQRGMLRREGSGFVPAGAGTCLGNIRNAPWAVCVQSGDRERAVCYGSGGENLLLVELVDVILARQYRVRKLDGASLEQWMLDSGLLEPPVLTREDLTELSALEEDWPEGERDVLLRLEKHRNGGPLLAVYEVVRSAGRRWICKDGRETNYTQEALSWMLTECFGKENE